MSYARFVEADVYVFLNVAGYYSCMACSLLPDREEIDHREYTTAGIISHLHAHMYALDYIPSDTFERLRADAAENDAWIQEKAQAQ